MSTVTVVAVSLKKKILFPASSNPAAHVRGDSRPPSRGRRASCRRLPVCSAAEAELCDQLAVGLEIGARQVIEQAAPPPHQRQQSAPRVVILPVKPQVFR